ncbi:MAG: hypothetical protein DBP02_07695 [gamma proteobacterium symbiont of Ctena orbiculata]|nr:MAG: hypothetical protein DBP02_07695 [gamma proteobacterium symbiont of Ctena orbiculata]
MNNNTKPTVYGLIPARGGSQGIKNKNLRNLGGIPLIYHIINTAKTVTLFDSIIVSTEDDRIAQSVEEQGVRVLRHDQSLSTNSSPSFLVVKNFLKIFQKDEKPPEIIVTMRATSPFCEPHYIDKAINALINNQKADSAISVVKAPFEPIHAFKINQDGSLNYIFSDIEHPKYPQQRQSHTHTYVRNGAFYATRTDVIENNSLWGTQILPIVMPKERSLNINDELDFIFAEFLLSNGYLNDQSKHK